ncbi:uncharacterized protein V6R79_010670 [Siganus canaliculatus]
MADGGERGAAGVSKSRIKPEIYRTDTGKIIVEDELLNFLAVKIKTLSQDDIVAMAVDHFGSEWIVNSTKVLFDLCPSSTRKLIAHTGVQKDARNVKSCLKLLNEVGEDAPRFVSHFLDNLPPVTFRSLDVSCLLGKIERLGADVHAMKQALSMQTSVCDDLRTVTADLHLRQGAFEQPDSSGTVPVSLPISSRTVPVLHANEENHVSAEAKIDVALSQGEVSQSMSLDVEPPAETCHWRHYREKKTAGIVGTGVGGSIQVIRTKLVSVFATKFAPALESEALASYLSPKLGRKVTCERLDTLQSRFSSFKVTAECKEIAEMYDPMLWPEGAFVRRFYEVRGSKASVRITSAGRLPVPEAGSSDAVK